VHQLLWVEHVNNIVDEVHTLASVISNQQHVAKYSNTLTDQLQIRFSDFASCEIIQHVVPTLAY
jgi:hypothetical protein